MSTYDDDDELWAHHRTIKVAIGLQSVEGSNQRVRHACMGMGAIRRAGHAVCAGLWSKNIVKVAARHQEPDDVGVAGSRGVVNCLQPGHRTSDRKQKHRSAYPKYRLRERVCACDRRERRERREKRERREREKREREEREERRERDREKRERDRDRERERREKREREKRQRAPSHGTRGGEGRAGGQRRCGR